MSEVVAADRSRLLRRKRDESSGIVLSRKRKLREFWAVCDHEGPLPSVNLSNPDAPPTNEAEQHFLDASDLLQNRLFDEANLPARRQLRSNASKQPSPARLVCPEPRIIDGSRKVTKPQRKDALKRSRATTPVANPDEPSHADLTNGNIAEGSAADGISMQRSSSKSSQTDLPVESAAVLNEIVEETFENATQEQPSQADTGTLPEALENETIAKGVESRNGSPGVDPRRAVPVSAEDAANLSEPLIAGQASHDVHHKAATVHLPPKEVQEQRLRDIKAERAARQQQQEQAGRLSINLPSRDAGRSADALSSPGSTSHSATTPAIHEASTDTSPDNESSRYEIDRLDEKDDVPETPPELRPSPEEAAKKDAHDRILEAQIEVSRAEILRSSPAAVDAQIRSEELAAVNSSEAAEDVPMGDAAPVESEKSDGLTKEAGEVVQDIVEDEEVAIIPAHVEKPTDPAPQVEAQAPEIADSEDDQTPVDAMDVDATTIKDSFETNVSTDSVPASNPAVPEEVVRPVEKSAKNSQEPSPATPTTLTPQPTPSAAVAPHPTLERMTTRVASGAMRHKSVSEILGEIPRPNTGSASDRSAVGKGVTDSDSAVCSNTPSRSTTPQSPGTRARSLVERAKDKERSKLSTVVFPKQSANRKSDGVALRANGKKEPQPEPEDYFLPMWRARPAGVQPIDSLLGTAHKTITTSNMFIPHLDGQTYKILTRIKHLQELNKWSLRQHKRSVEPNRPTTHWDVLLQEAKWMRTDFREERKWKMAIARNLAFACAEWHEANAEDKKLLQVKATPPPLKPAAQPSKDVQMIDLASNQSHSTPDLIASAIDADSPIDEFDDEPRLDLQETVAPTAIFGLQDDDVIFGLRRSPGTDKLLDELPLYSAPLSVPQSTLPTSDIDPDAAWRRPALPLSKYVEGRMELKNDGPPRMRSRFDYEDEEDDEDSVVFGEQPVKRPKLAPEMTNVALFNPENKHIRDRIHAGHQFRPPSEYQMPLQNFFENRTASQWTWAEDDELKSLVREYSYNWSLISSMLTSKSMFSSGSERRTPWECFERWVHLEGIPADMQRTQYFKAYNNRIEMAQRSLLEQAAMAAPPQPGQIVNPPKRRYTTSVRVERRRNQKHLTLVDAMRKLAKKRETSLQKQQHAAGLAAMRKANEVAPQPRAPAHTPQDFSKLKHERELQVQERIARFAQQQEQQRRQQASLAAQRNPQMLQPGGPSQQVNRAAAAPSNGQPIPNPNQLAVPGQNRPRTAMAPSPMVQVPMPNGHQLQPLPTGVPQAQMHGRLPVPNPALDMNLVSQARRISEQQRHAVQMQQQSQQHAGQPSQIHNSPPNMRNSNSMNGMSQPFIPTPNMMPPFNPNPHGISTPPPPGQGVPTPGSAGSPRMGQPGGQMLSNGTIPQVSTIEAQIRQRNPNATPDQIHSMIRDSMQKQVHQRQLSQSAMNAAAGSNINGNGGQPRVPSGMETNPVLYAQMLRAQQQQQQQANTGQGNQTPVQQPQQQQVPRTGSAGSNGGTRGNDGNNGNGGT